MPDDRSAPRLPVPALTGADESLRPYIRQRFPGGLAIGFEGDGLRAAAETKEAILGGQKIVYGAAFAGEGILIIFDVLAEIDGRWFGYVFKPSTRIKERHLVDVALCDQIAQSAGFYLDEPCLLLLNMQYVRRGSISPQDLFIEERVGRRLRIHQHLVRGRMQMLKRMGAKAVARAAAGEAQVKPGTPRPQARSEMPPVSDTPAALEVDRASLRGFLDGLRYPLYFMDFEAYQTAVPEYDGHWPFRQLPFQFSVHRLDAPGGALHQEAFIAPGDAEPTGAFGAALLDATGTEGSVLVYNVDSEQLILDQLEGDHPQWSGPIEALRKRLVDLIIPFSRQYIRIPSIGNKLSLKYILPALVPDMSYSALEIAGGDEANQAYNALRESSDLQFIEATRTALLAYCEVDTLAMVRILEKMVRLCDEPA
ncbi:MAG: hypothetical protein JWP27_1656 [Flaviaesturariibacter sp.]|nr:hypothetical protein [Flaviaesturariibacter sp.]